MPKAIQKCGYAVLLAAVLLGHLSVAHFLASDDDSDGDLYTQIASNVLERHVYSKDTDPPFEPTLVRLPGYPLFVSGVYALFGHGNNEALRLVQGVLNTLTCVLIALLACMWEPKQRHKRRAALAAFLLAAVCPFTAIYSAVLLTEAVTMFQSVALVVAATFAFLHRSPKITTAWWIVAGFLAGAVQLFRPDAGLFAAAVGFALVGHGLIRFRAGDRIVLGLCKSILMHGSVFSCSFVLVLLPWTIRNACVFHVFQPLAPVYCNMPGQFVPKGYFAWFRTWADSERYLKPLYWRLGPDKPMNFDDVPPRAFDTDSERSKVASLFDRYNHPQAPSQTPGILTIKNQLGDDEGHADMTRDIDAGFARLARDRIAREPLRYYFGLPLKRAMALWFVPHAQYYPFEGELFPPDALKDWDNDDFWLLLFSLLTWTYTIVGVAGAWFLWRTDGSARKYAILWLLLATLLILPRWVYMSTLEHTEPRYVVEFFPFLSVLGGLAISRLFGKHQKKCAGLTGFFAHGVNR
jgi:Dolichyl-phosphate-mannose-protein mannosyltransferase